MELNAIPFAHTLEFLGNELGSVIHDNCFWDVESCNDVGLDEFDHNGGFDFGEGFSFGPLCVVLGCSQDKDFRFGASDSVSDKGSTISNAHIEKGQGEDNGWREDAGAWILSA